MPQDHKHYNPIKVPKPTNHNKTTTPQHTGKGFNIIVALFIKQKKGGKGFNITVTLFIKNKRILNIKMKISGNVVVKVPLLFIFFFKRPSYHQGSIGTHFVKHQCQKPFLSSFSTHPSNHQCSNTQQNRTRSTIFSLPQF